MLTAKPTPEMIEQWKKTFEEYRFCLRANRKPANELIKYFESKYPFSKIEDVKFEKKFVAATARNITENEHSRNKLPAATKPKIKSYCVENVYIGIDSVSGEFHIESEDMEKAAAIYDDLFAYRGLDDEDLKNYFLVAQYVSLTRGS